jgi:hypothetical protein
MSKNRRPARPSKSYRPNRTVARFRNFSDLSGIGLADIYSEAYMTLELILTVCSIVQGQSGCSRTRTSTSRRQPVGPRKCSLTRDQGWSPTYVNDARRDRLFPKKRSPGAGKATARAPMCNPTCTMTCARHPSCLTSCSPTRAVGRLGRKHRGAL